MVKKNYVVAGAVVVSATVATVAIVRAVKRRRNRILPRGVRKLMIELMGLQGEDFLPQRLPGGGIGKSLFIKRIERVDDRKLMAIFALMEVGYFLKASGIDPTSLTKDDLRRVASKFRVELAGAPKDRAALIGELDTSDAYDALRAAYAVLCRK
jgi:hypothetical protein